jgi:hypothetical protein
VGNVGTTSVTYNSLTGRGDGAIDTYRVVDSSVTVANNDTSRWIDLRPWIRHLKQQLRSPLTWVWMMVLLLIGFTAIRGRRKRSLGHPYPDWLPLAMPLPTTSNEIVTVATPSPQLEFGWSLPARSPRQERELVGSAGRTDGEG